MRRSTFIFKENHDFTEEEDNPSHKVVLAEEELAAIDINGIANLVDRPRITFIDEECGTVVDGGEFTRNNNRKKESELLQVYRCQLCDKCYRRH